MKKRGFLSSLLLALLVIAASYVVYRYRYAILERLSVWKYRIFRCLGLKPLEDEDEDFL